jgi:hypothetical protein
LELRFKSVLYWQFIIKGERMNIKKILIGGVILLGISHCPLMGGNVEPEWVKVHRYHLGKIATTYQRKYYPYRGAVDGKIEHGQFSSSVYNLTDGRDPLKKIVIKQKTPCYVVPLHWNEFRNKHTFNKWTKRPKERLERVGKDTVVVYKGESRERGGVRTTFISDKMRIKNRRDATASTAKLIMGDGFSCLDKPNSETWTVYWWLKKSSSSKYEWVKVATEKMR